MFEEKKVYASVYSASRAAGFTELVESGLELFRRFMETVKGESERIYAETLEEFRRKVDAIRIPE